MATIDLDSKIRTARVKRQLLTYFLFIRQRKHKNHVCPMQGCNANKRGVGTHPGKLAILKQLQTPNSFQSKPRNAIPTCSHYTPACTGLHSFLLWVNKSDCNKLSDEYGIFLTHTSSYTTFQHTMFTFYVVVLTFGQENRHKILNRLLLQVAFW